MAASGTTMSPGAHLLISWLSGVNIFKNRRERCLIAIAGVAPDLDGFGLIIDKISGTTSYFLQYHHYLGHSIFSAVVISSIASVISRNQKAEVWCVAFFVVHLHILCDITGSKGPDGHRWPIYYLYPLDSTYGITWEHQWELNAWQNILIMAILLLLSGYYAATKGLTFLEVFSGHLNNEAFRIYNKYLRKKSNTR